MHTPELRNFTLSLEPAVGLITFFYAFLNGVMVIQEDGYEKRTWSGKIPLSQMNLKIRVVGIGASSFKLSINLPGAAEDQSLTLQLQSGYFEIDLTL